jgi:hypothetical protein
VVYDLVSTLVLVAFISDSKSWTVLAKAMQAKSLLDLLRQFYCIIYLFFSFSFKSNALRASGFEFSLSESSESESSFWVEADWVKALRAFCLSVCTLY